MTDQSSTPQSIPKTVSAYQRVSDVDVLMTIVRPPRIVGLGNVLILNPNVEQLKNPDTSSARDKLGLTENDRENGVYMRKTDTKSGATYVEYHEVFEGIFKPMLSTEQRQALINEFKSQQGEFIDRQTGKKIHFAALVVRP